MSNGNGRIAIAVLGGLVLGGIGGGIAGGLAGGVTGTTAQAAGNPTLDRWSICLDWVEFVTAQQAAGVPDNRIDTTGALLSNKGLSNEPDSVSITEGTQPTTPPVNNTEQRQTPAIVTGCGNASEIRAARETDITYLDLFPPSGPAETFTYTPSPTPS